MILVVEKPGINQGATVTMKTFADAEVALAANLPAYEARPHQQAFASAVEDALSTGRHLVAEAGCGTGKSLGYLIPAILSGKRVVISTATKALQDQLVEKDLPFLKEHLGVDFTFALLKGRSNYVCRANALQSTETDVSRIVERMGDGDFDGQRDSLTFDVEHRTWRSVTITSEDCPGKKKCAFGDTCFAEKAKADAQEAQIIVVNHALLFTDLMIKDVTGGFGSMLGNYSYVIFDEAHEAENYAGSVFGQTFTEGKVRQLTTEVSNFAKNMGAEATTAVNELLGAMVGVWNILPDPRDENVGNGRIRPAFVIAHKDEFIAMTNALMGLERTIRGWDATGWDDKAKTRQVALERRAMNITARFSEAVLAADEDLVRWVEVEKWGRHNENERLTLKTAPVNVGTILRPLLFEEGNGITCVLVSATMATNGNFDYITGRLGIDDYRSIDVGTPFDFENQAILYVPKHLPEPKGKDLATWRSLATAEIGSLVKTSNGRALLLFTSFADLNYAYDTLAAGMGHTVLKQGQEANKVLAQRFMDDPSSVLFATRSFFTGVDFQGDACSLVVMSKLPFPVPSDPMNEARCEVIRAHGGSDFKEYTIPEMILPLKQGFGRLIRHRNDRGVVAILDPRLTTKPYGRAILNSLPDAPVVDTHEAVADFFAKS